MDKHEIAQIKDGVRLFNVEMKRISKIIKDASRWHRKRFEESSKAIHKGIRVTDGRL